MDRFGGDIWIADGPIVRVAGFAYPTRTAVIRLRDGGLFVWSPTRLDEDLRAAVGHLGPVRHIVAPNTLHHLFVADWLAAWPDAIAHGVLGMRAKRPDVAWGDDLSDGTPPAWVGEIDQVLVTGNRLTTEAVFFHRASRTVIVTDLIQHFPSGWFRGWRAAVAHLDLMTAARPTVPRKFRVAFRDRRAARAAVRRIVAWPSERVVMAHGAPIVRDGQAALAHAFGWLLRD